jgi:Anti-sigma-K factor rskA/Sigma-70 region 2
VDTPKTSWSRPLRTETPVVCLLRPRASSKVGFLARSPAPRAEPTPSRRSDYQNATDEELAAGFAAGNEQCLELAFRRWSPLIHTVARRTLDSPSEADDVTQQVFVAAWRGQLSRLVELSRREPDPALGQMPRDTVWRGIQAELARSESAGGQQTQAAGPAPPAQPVPPGLVNSDSPPRVRRGSRVLVGLAAAIGVIVGIGTTAIVNRIQADDAQVLSSTALVALPGHAGEGTAQLIRERDTTELRVSVEGAPPQQEFREVWLINADGKQMYSLGVLPTAGTGSYPLPARLGNSLEGFNIVDVSIEPYDGNVEHSRNSQVRGTLPG